MDEKYFVTGATGNVGSPLVDYLLSFGKPVIAASRSVKVSERENLEYRLFDFLDSTTWENALDKISRIFLMRPPHISKIKRDMVPFLAFLKQKEISQVVFLSVQGAESNSLVPHHKVEQAIFDLELPYTILRPSFFMQNLTTTHLEEIRDDHMVFVPTGEGKTNFIDTRDIGEIAGRVMVDDSHLNRAYTITGETSYSHREIALALSRHLEVEVRFVNPGPIRFIGHHLRRKRKLGMTLVMLALYSMVKTNKGDVTTDDSLVILGRRPIGLDRFIRNHLELFKGKGFVRQTQTACLDPPVS